MSAWLVPTALDSPIDCSCTHGVVVPLSFDCPPPLQVRDVAAANDEWIATAEECNKIHVFKRTAPNEFTERRIFPRDVHDNMILVLEARISFLPVYRIRGLANSCISF